MEYISANFSTAFESIHSQGRKAEEEVNWNNLHCDFGRCEKVGFSNWDGDEVGEVICVWLSIIFLARHYHYLRYKRCANFVYYMDVISGGCLQPSSSSKFGDISNVRSARTRGSCVEKK